MITSSWKAFLSMKQTPKYYELYYQDHPKEKYHFLSSVRECLKHSPGSTKERKFGIKAHYRGLISSDTCALLLLTCLEGWENRFPVSTSSVLLCHFELGLQRTAVVGMKFLGGGSGGVIQWHFGLDHLFSLSLISAPFYLVIDWLLGTMTRCHQYAGFHKVRKRLSLQNYLQLNPDMKKSISWSPARLKTLRNSLQNILAQCHQPLECFWIFYRTE